MVPKKADDTTLDIVPVNPNAPSVNAGVDMVTWSGESVALDPDVVNNDTTIPQGTLTYEWNAESSDPNNTTVLFDPDEFAEAPMVTVIKTSDDPVAVKLTLAVTLEGVDTVSGTMTIDVYDDACKASSGNGHEYAATDFDGDCITTLGDFAVMAEAWLVDYTLTEPVEKP